VTAQTEPAAKLLRRCRAPLVTHDFETKLTLTMLSHATMQILINAYLFLSNERVVLTVRLRRDRWEHAL
jgi:hypothetical protein